MGLMKIGLGLLFTLLLNTGTFAQVVDFSLASQSDTESVSSFTLTVQLDAVSLSNIDIPFTVSGSATEGVADDFTITASPVTIPAGQLSVDIIITVNDDSETESDETVIVTLGTPSLGTLGTITEHTATINDNDTPPVVTIVSPADLTEVIEGTNVTFEGTADDAEDGDLTANLSWDSDLTGNIGNAGGPFDVGDLSVGSHVITASVSDLSGLTGSASVTVTINAQTSAFTTASQNDLESVGTLLATIELAGTTDVDIDVPFTISGTATEGVANDFTVSASPLTIPAGQLSADIIITVNDDSETESDETVVVTLGVPSLGTLGTITEHTATINDNDTPPTVTITSPVDGVTEAMGTTISFAATVSDPEGEDLEGSLSWESDLDGVIGTGASFSTTTLSPGMHMVTARVQDSGGLEGNDIVIVNITNTPPVVTILEPADGTTVVGGTDITFSATIIDAEEANLAPGLTWIASLDGGIGSGASVTANLSVGTQSVTASVTDGGGLEGSDAVTVIITAPNAAPLDIILSNSTVAENQASGTVVGTFTTIDLDVGDTHTYTLVSGTGDTDNGSFSIVGDQLQTAAVLDFESGSSLSIRVQTEDATAETFQKEFIITVTDENEAPTDMVLSSSTVAENQASGTTVGTLSTTDPDAGDTHTYTLVSGTGDTDNASFSIVGDQLQTAAVLDFESGSSLSIRVQTEDAIGATFQEAFTITITDENEAPTDITLSSSTVAENQVSGTTVGTLSSTDPDTGDTHTYTLVSGTGDTDNASFSIVGDQLQTAAVLDFESGSSLSVRVQTADATGATFQEAFTITITDENESPTDIALSSSTVAENQSTGTAVGTFTTTDPDTGDTHTYTLVSGTGDTDNSSFSIVGDQLQTAVVLDFELGSSLSIRVQTADATGATFQEAFTITVTDTNDPPTDITLSNNTLQENLPAGTTVGTLTTTDADVGETHTYTLVSGSGDADNASFSIVDAQLQTAVVLNFEVDNSLNIRVQTADGGGSTFSKAFTISVTDVNDLPVAVDDIDNTTSGTAAITINVAGNDTDEDGNVVPSSVAIVTNPPNGTAVNNGDGTITYTPNAGYEGGDNFTYTINDDQGETSLPGDVVITVGPNNPPVANDDLSNTTLEDVSININVVANDTDSDGSIDPASISILTDPANGIAVANNDGTVTYTPNPDVNGTDEFNYSVTDNLGATSNQARVVVNINPVNDPPVANNDTRATPEETLLTIDVLTNDNDLADAPGGALVPSTVTIVADPTNGIAVVNLDGTVDYTPNDGFNGADFFTYTVDDNEGATSNVATVTINVSSVNDPPVAVDDPLNPGTEDIAMVINVLANDFDSDGSIVPSSVLIVDLPLNGTAVSNPDGTVTYTPNPEFNGDDDFTYTVEDDLGAVSNIATVSIQVASVNDPPVAVDDINNSTNEDTPIIINLTVNDSDPDGTIDNSTIMPTDPSNGTVTVLTNGNVQYSPNQDFNGTDSFTYTVNDDGGATSNQATVSIVVNDINDPPVAVDDVEVTDEDQEVTINLISNDSDVDGTLIISTLTLTTPSNGTIVNNGDGSVRYIPNPNFNGQDSFTYTIADDDGDISNIAQVNITINDINDAPVANDDAVNTDEDVMVTIVVILNDTDVDGTIVGSSVTLVTAPSNGTAVVKNNGDIDYTPNTNFNGLETFTYTVEDDDGAQSNIATVTISVNAINDALVAADDLAETDEDVEVQIDILANDQDPDTPIDPSSVVIVTTPVNGVATVNADGTVDYNPAPLYNGQDSFTYNVKNTMGQVSNIATVTIIINDINNLPVAMDDSIRVFEDEVSNLNILENDSDVDGTIDVSGVSIVTGPSNGTIEITTQQVLYSPFLNYVGEDLFIYTVADDDGGVSNEATVKIDVRDVNDPPSDLILNNTFVDEVEPIGTVIGTFGTVDVDPDEVFTYSLVSGAGDEDNGAFSIFEDKLLSQVTFDQDQQEFYNIRVKTDDGASSLTKNFVITVYSQRDPIGIIPGDLPRFHPVTNPSETYNVTVEEEVSVDTVLFRYRSRTSDRNAWTISGLTGQDRFYETVVPASAFDEVGIEYEFVFIDTDGGSISLIGYTYNQYSGDGLNFEKLVFGELVKDYNLLSIPLKLANGNVANVLDELGSYDQTLWRLFTYQNNQLVEYNEGLNTLQQGQGYWLIMKDQKEMSTGPGSTELIADREFNLHLDKGMNLIGNPYGFTVSWIDVLRFNNIRTGRVEADISVYDGGYVSTGLLAPFQGAFVMSDVDTTLRVPLLKDPAIQHGRTGSPNQIQDENNWEVDLNLTTPNFKDQLGGLGMREDAENSKDQYDRIRPPRFIEYLEVKFLKPEYFMPDFSRDIVPTANEHIWEFTVETNVSDQQIRMDWSSIPIGDYQKELWLYHKDMEVIINMQQVQHYDFSNQQTHNFAVYYGDSEFIDRELHPDGALLTATYPNPFTDHLTVTFSLPSKINSDYSKLSVYDLMGRKIKNLWDEKYRPGFYQVEWDGTYSSGLRVPGGTYLLKLDINGQESIYRRVIKK
ncbi:MAG: hypothetical protein DHS20C17_14070 [Cyclobacteriaceae bacterium]|nr:MAG: hypothetical protein DHS20C17_14070 [Cyclobacteriaceae bacterium]